MNNTKCSLQSIAEIVATATQIEVSVILEKTVGVQEVIDARHLVISVAIDLKYDRTEVADYIGVDRSTTYNSEKKVTELADLKELKKQILQKIKDYD